MCVTTRSAQWNPIIVAEGSVQKKCKDCGTGVWLSKSGQSALAGDPEIRLRCTDCLAKLLKEGNVNVGFVPGALAEALENIQKNIQKQKKV